jgi:histidine triad (HIT) family protein
MTTYDATNIFAKILRGEIPSHKIYEDAHTLAIMDVMPMVEGHCLVLPKAPSRNLLDATPEALAAMMATVQKVAKAAKRAFAADGVQIRQYNEPAAGQSVFHLHVHVLPLHEGQKVGAHSGVMADQAVLAAQAAKIKAAL